MWFLEPFTISSCIPIPLPCQDSASAPSTATASHVTHNSPTSFAISDSRHQTATSGPGSHSTRTVAPTAGPSRKTYSVADRFAPPPYQVTQTANTAFSETSPNRRSPNERLGFKPAVLPALHSHQDVIVVHAESPFEFYVQIATQSTAFQLAQLNRRMK